MLVKLVLDTDGTTVLRKAAANQKYQAGDTDSLGGDYIYYDVSNTSDEIAEMSRAVNDGAVKLTNQTSVQDVVIVTPATDKTKAVTKTVTRISGTLTVDAGYTPAPDPEPDTTTSAQDTINATLLKQTAQNAAANAAIMKQLATITAADTAKEA